MNVAIRLQSIADLTTGYMTGFGNQFDTEALPGALPVGRNLQLQADDQDCWAGLPKLFNPAQP